MRTRVLVIGLVACTTSLVGATPALAAKRCVGSGAGCYPTIQGALDASHDGDAIKVGSGAFAGGITIAKSMSITGAGADATVIRGGGPVVTIGTLGAATEPPVSISGVRITGGRTNSSPATDLGAGGTAQARGGGVFVPPGANGGKGATVAIRDSVIAGNRAAPTTTLGPDPDQVPFWPACPSGPCRYAQADGGGIDNWGDMTLTSTTVSDNEAGGPVASDATGAGIWSNLGTLTLVKCKVLRNRAAVVAPNGRFAEGGGVLVQGGALAMRETVIGDNATNLTSTLPSFVGDTQLEMTSQAGGLLVAGQAPATIERALFTGNESTAIDPVGEPAAYDSALLVLDGPLTMRDSVVSGNRAVASSATGTATTQGAGVYNNSLLELRNVVVGGPGIERRGGGLFATLPVTLTRTRIAGNVPDQCFGC